MPLTRGSVDCNTFIVCLCAFRNPPPPRHCVSDGVVTGQNTRIKDKRGYFENFIYIYGQCYNGLFCVDFIQIILRVIWSLGLLALAELMRLAIQVKRRMRRGGVTGVITKLELAIVPLFFSVLHSDDYSSKIPRTDFSAIRCLNGHMSMSILT